MDVVAALDFGGTKIALATATPAGEILEQARIDTEPAGGAERALARAMEAARTLLAPTGGRCLAVGAVCPGIPRADEVLLAPNVPGWGDLAFEREIRAGLGVERVAVRNDVKAAAAAELRWGALRGADPAVFVSLGTGIAAAIAAGGRGPEGAHDRAAGRDDRELHALVGLELAARRADEVERVGGRGDERDPRQPRPEGRAVALGQREQLARVGLLEGPQRRPVRQVDPHRTELGRHGL